MSKLVGKISEKIQGEESEESMMSQPQSSDMRGSSNKKDITPKHDGKNIPAGRGMAQDWKSTGNL